MWQNHTPQFRTFERFIAIMQGNKVKPLARTPPAVFGLGFGCLGRAWKEGSRRGTAEQQEKEHIEVDDVVFQSCNMGINRSNVLVLAIGRALLCLGIWMSRERLKGTESIRNIGAAAKAA